MRSLGARCAERGRAPRIGLEPTTLRLTGRILVGALRRLPPHYEAAARRIFGIRKYGFLLDERRERHTWSVFRIPDMTACAHGHIDLQAPRPESRGGARERKRRQSRARDACPETERGACRVRRHVRRVRALQLPGLLRARPRERLASGNADPRARGRRDPQATRCCPPHDNLDKKG